MRNVVVIGGGGVRTPLLVYGLVQSQSLLQIANIVLFDVDSERIEIIAGLCREVSRQFPEPPKIQTETDLETALDGADFVLNSIRVGGISARARDERIAIQHGLAGQETTGPGGAAMALRTLPVILEQAKLVEKVAPATWFINFTNPAGLVTQALTQNTGLKVVGICDTPAELFGSIASALGEERENLSFGYAGLNHLGWISRVSLQGREITERLLNDAEMLRNCYSSNLFDVALIQTLRLIPTEYLFFYYSQRRALANQLKAGASRGEEVRRLNETLFSDLSRADASTGIDIYRRYLMQRNSSYMKIESQAGSAFAFPTEEQDPFTLATGYHRIAVDVMCGLVSDTARRVVVNVQNKGAINGLREDDVVEVSCEVASSGVRPEPVGDLPDSVKGLVLSVKAYERTLIAASLSRSRRTAALALLEYPIVGDWELANDALKALCADDPTLAYLTQA